MNNLLLDDLLQKISNKDRNALGELYDITSGSVFGYALSIVCDNYIAEDIGHDVYIQVFKNAKSYKSQGKAMAWILRITRNISYNMIKKQKFETIICNGDINLLSESYEMEKESIDKLILDEILSKLPDKERETIVLYLFAGISQKDISKITGVPLPTVKWRYKNALKKLSNIINID